MRIVGGKWAGTDLTSPSGKVRPSAEALRDSMMTGLGAELSGARVLDLFAGSGALGLEALSRGARSCDFVENSPAAIHALKANVAALRAGRAARIFLRDAIQFAERLAPDSYDIVLADPPYGSKKLDRLIRRWLEVPFTRLLVVEHAADHILPARGVSRRLGDSVLTSFRRD
jgi:16S rRNA (guanine966-N2)-methyltransferase